MKRVLMVFYLISVFSFLGTMIANGEEKSVSTLEEVVVTATRYEQKVEKIPAMVTVLDKDEIEASGAQSIPELLQFLGGITVRDLNGNGNNQVVDMGGFGESADRHVVVLINGRRVNPIDLSGIRWTSIPIENVEKIEILHGSGSVLYGDHAIGGVINIITKRIKEDQRGNFKLLGGSLETGKANIEIGFNKKGTGIQMGFCQFATDGYRENSQANRENFYLMLRHKTEGPISLSFRMDSTYADYELPGSLTEAQMNQDRRQSITPNDGGEDEDVSLSLSIEADFEEKGLFNITLSRRDEDRRSEIISWNSIMDFNIITHGLVFQYILDSFIHDHENRLTSGIDIYRVDYEANRNSGQGIYDHSRNTFAGYIQEEFNISDSLVLNSGIRYESVTTKLGGVVGGNEVGVKFDDGEWAWNVGLAYSFIKDSKIYGRIFRSFRYPVVDEYMLLFTGAVNTNLKQETAIGYEMGLKFLKDKIRGDLRAYILDVSDEIAWNNVTFQNENLQDTRHTGVELNLNIRPFNILSIYGGIGYLNAEFDKGPNEGKRIPLVPEWKGNLGINIFPIKGLRIKTQYNFVGKRYFGNDYGNTQKEMESYDTVDIYLSYRLKNIEFFINGKNIFNEKYSDYGFYSSWFNSFNYYPMPEATFLGGINMVF